MAFWALGKVKNLSQKLNFKDYKEYGSKIISNYMANKQAQDSQFIDIPIVDEKPSGAQAAKSSQQGIIKNQQSKINKKSQLSQISRKSKSHNKQSLSDSQWLQIQLSQYKKLTEMQSRLMMEHQKREQRRLEQEYQRLERQLVELQRQQAQQIESMEKQRIKNRVREGTLTLQQLIKQNIHLREEIQRKKL